MSELTALSERDLLIGVSVSEPSSDELVALGLSEVHVRHAFIEICRHLLARGWSIGYGGDLRRSGYTESMFDLVRTYDRKDLAGPERVRSFLPWPVWLDLSNSQRAELANVATLIEIGAPDGAPAALGAISDRSPAERLWNSVALSEMRRAMTDAIDARVVLGGRLSGQQGLVPGVTEEAFLALDAGVPLYVAGGFGGCGQVIAAALLGEPQSELTSEYQVEHTSGYTALLDAALGGTAGAIELGGVFANAGVEGLRNGLGADENVRLFQTDDVDEVVALVLRGLRRI